MARLYSNENFPRPVVDELRRLGHDVVTALEAEQANRGLSDAEVLAFAIREGRAVLTINRDDFVRLHAQRPTHHGIVTCTMDLDFDGQARRIHRAIADSASLANLLLRINRA